VVLEKLWESVKKNHFAQMAICCALPIVVIFALEAMGYTGGWVFAIAIAVCVGSHIVMSYFASKEGKTCH
jgi:hypothetical protein